MFDFNALKQTPAFVLQTDSLGGHPPTLDTYSAVLRDHVWTGEASLLCHSNTLLNFVYRLR